MRTAWAHAFATFVIPLRLLIDYLDDRKSIAHKSIIKRVQRSCIFLVAHTDGRSVDMQHDYL